MQNVWKREGNMGTCFGKMQGLDEEGRCWQEVVGWILGEEGSGEWWMVEKKRRKVEGKRREEDGESEGERTGREGEKGERDERRERRGEGILR